MNEIMLKFFALSVSGTIISIVLFALKPQYKDKFGKTWQYYIWLIVILRLLLPFSYETNIGSTLFTKTGEVLSTQSNTAVLVNDIPDAAQDYIPQASQPSLDQNITETKFFDTIKSGIWLIWIGVSVMLFVRKATSYLSFVRYIKSGVNELEDYNALAVYEAACQNSGLKKPLKIYSNKLASSPMLVGILNPFIVIPDMNMDENELYYVFIHELTHYKRMDIFYKWFAQLAVSVHWFNPIIYFVNYEINKNCELSCDEAIIKALDDNGKRSYGDTLLASVKLNGSYGNAIIPITLNEDAKLLKERLEAIMKFKRKTKLISSFTIVLTLAVLFGASVTWAYADDGKPSMQPILTVTEEPAILDFPFITAHVGSYDSSYYDELAEKAYNSDEMQYFSIILPKVSNTKKIEFVTRAYDDDKMSFFTVALNNCSFDSEKLDSLAEKAYKDEKINFYSVLITRVSNAKKVGFVTRAYDDDKMSYFAVALNNCSFDSEKLMELMERAYEDDRVSYFSVLLNHFSSISKNTPDNTYVIDTHVYADTSNPKVIEFDSSTGMTFKSGYFAGHNGDTLYLEITSAISDGKAELILIAPSGNEHRLSFDKVKNEIINFSLTEESFWQYQCTGLNLSGYIKITGTIIKGDIETPSLSDSLSKAAKAATALMQGSGNWEITELLIPFVSESCIDILVATYNDKHQLTGADAKKASDYYNMPRADADERAYTMTQKNGTWQFIEPFLPYMTNKGIDDVIALYNQKHRFNEQKRASDYYNTATTGQ